MDQKIMSDLRELYAERLDEIVTDPSLANLDLPLDWGEKVRRAEQIDYCNLTRDALAGVCDDLRLPRGSLSRLRHHFLLSTPTRCPQ